MVFGPDLVVLGPHESFNVLFLSGEWEWLQWGVAMGDDALPPQLGSPRRKEL